jgi:poly-gamma-glutamate synthesis protein (capsule biosynthesis protein)
VRFVGYFVAGALAQIGLYISILMAWSPRDPAVAHAEPLRIGRPASLPGEALLLFAGDTLEGDAANPLLSQKGYQYPLQLTVDLIREADLAIVNQEGPITDGGDRFPIYKDYIYRALAPSAAALAWAGVDVITEANNHATDWGASGLADTARLATENGMVMIGAGADEVQARRGLIATVGDTRVGLLAFCQKKWLWRWYVDQFARRGHYGIALLSEANLRDDIARLRRQSEVVIVTLHGGENYEPPTAEMRRWAERAIDLGADLVVMHHPHVAHPVAMYAGKPILLSLGNWAFGTPGQSELDYGLLAFAHVRAKKLAQLELVPIAVQNRKVGYRPEPLHDQELDRALAKLRDDSARYGARLGIDHGRAVLTW